MLLWKLLIFALQNLTILQNVDGQFKDFQYMKVKRLKCTSDFKFVYENLTCFAKPLNRNQTGINVDIWYKKPMTSLNVRIFKFNLGTLIEFDFQIEIITFYRYGTIYRQVLKAPKMDFCSLNPNSQGIPLIKEVVKIVQNLDESLVHPCPFYGYIVKNKPLSISTLPSIFAQGDYKMTFNFTSKKDQGILFIEFLTSLISSEKHSFGQKIDQLNFKLVNFASIIKI